MPSSHAAAHFDQSGVPLGLSARLLLVGRSKGLKGGARRTPGHQESLADTELDHTVLPRLGVCEAEGGEGEILAAILAVTAPG